MHDGVVDQTSVRATSVPLVGFRWAALGRATGQHSTSRSLRAPLPRRMTSAVAVRERRGEKGSSQCQSQSGLLSSF